MCLQEVYENEELKKTLQTEDKAFPIDTRLLVYDSLTNGVPTRNFF